MIISIMNLKGGIGKTTTTVNLGYLIAEKQNKRVLIIDNDPQGNASSFFQIQKTNDKNLPQIFTEVMDGSILPIIPQHTQYKRVDILTSDMNLSTCNIELSKQKTDKQLNLYKNIIENIVQHYDVILIDNAPNITPLTVSALLASNKVIIPVEADKLSIDGANEVINQITEANRAGFNELRLGGILFTKFNKRARVDNETFKYVKNGQLTGGIKHKVYDTAIRHTVKVKEATFSRKPLEFACKNSNAACDYRKLLEEI